MKILVLLSCLLFALPSFGRIILGESEDYTVLAVHEADYQNKRNWESVTLTGGKLGMSQQIVDLCSTEASYGVTADLTTLDYARKNRVPVKIRFQYDTQKDTLHCIESASVNIIL